MSDAVGCSAGCPSKVVLLEFAAVRRGSQADLACEEAPEAAMHPGAHLLSLRAVITTTSSQLEGQHHAQRCNE